MKEKDGKYKRQQKIYDVLVDDSESFVIKSSSSEYTTILYIKDCASLFVTR